MKQTPAGNVGTTKTEGAHRQLWSTITSSSPVCSPGVVWDVRRLAGLLLTHHFWRPALQVRWVRLLRKDWHQPERRDELSLVPRALPRCEVFLIISNMILLVWRHKNQTDKLSFAICKSKPCPNDTDKIKTVSTSYKLVGTTDSWTRLTDSKADCVAPLKVAQPPFKDLPKFP